LSGRPNKSDELDAEGLAQLARTGWYAEVRVKSLDSHRVRAVLVGRAKLVIIKRTLSNTIRSLLKTFGLFTGRARGKGFAEKVRAALAFKTVIDRPERFRRAEEVAAYVGLAPKRHQSGEVDRMGRISRCGDTLLRSDLFEAATVALLRVSRANAPATWAKALAKRVGLGKARVALARKLAVTLFCSPCGERMNPSAGRSHRRPLLPRPRDGKAVRLGKNRNKEM
jgi:transposase